MSKITVYRSQIFVLRDIKYNIKDKSGTNATHGGYKPRDARSPAMENYPSSNKLLLFQQAKPIH